MTPERPIHAQFKSCVQGVSQDQWLNFFVDYLPLPAFLTAFLFLGHAHEFFLTKHVRPRNIIKYHNVEFLYSLPVDVQPKSNIHGTFL